jgi:hypothetical protein
VQDNGPADSGKAQGLSSAHQEGEQPNRLETPGALSGVSITNLHSLEWDSYRDPALACDVANVALRGTLSTYRNHILPCNRAATTSIGRNGNLWGGQPIQPQDVIEIPEIISQAHKAARTVVFCLPDGSTRVLTPSEAMTYFRSWRQIRDVTLIRNGTLRHSSPFELAGRIGIPAINRQIFTLDGKTPVRESFVMAHPTIPLYPAPLGIYHCGGKTGYPGKSSKIGLSW